MLGGESIKNAEMERATEDFASAENPMSLAYIMYSSPGDLLHTEKKKQNRSTLFRFQFNLSQYTLSFVVVKRAL